MGCSPLGQMVSTVFDKCGEMFLFKFYSSPFICAALIGRERRRASKVMIVSPPPSYLYARPRTVVKSVSFSNDNPIIIIPPNQNQQQAEAPPMPPGHQSTGTHVAAEGAEPARVRFAGGGRPKDAGPPPSGPVHPEPVTAQRCASHGYVMSPLPRWEERPRRREYFSENVMCNNSCNREMNP
ncbi:hypothetical protein HPP92_027347 [Vanilla planifolia]|uniref:Uncharacterized protein n=1 Tax=Vanilla planifolia TaxID=51239 RepID=A0A835U4L7_VANPL|nr:hypothetical protein HPP92_027347 [Vanilla planifolia]